MLGTADKFIEEIAVEVVTTAEINCRANRIREFEWRVRRKEELEEGARQYLSLSET